MMNPAVAFKEWAAVCAAIADGTQTVILRKGGIAEVDGQFRPEHSRFWLYPTYYHTDRAENLKPGPWIELAEVSRPAAGTVVLATIVEVLDVAYLTEPDAVLALDAKHILTSATVEQRFHYRQPGLFALKLRATNVEPLTMVEKPEYAGCKSWVKL